MPHPLILQGFGGVAPKVYFASTYIHSILQQPTFYLCKKHKSTDGRTEKYFYNNRNQLTELHREKDVVRYSYDPAGNLTEENYLTADGASTKKLHYAYDVYNRNVSVTGDDFTQKNHYDAEGYRNSITEKDKVTNSVYQGGMLLHELDEDKNPARHYVLGNEYIGLDHNYYLTDEQGSVRYVLDAAGNVQNDYRYDAFGQRIAGHENIPNRLRYNAQIEDDLTGLYYMRARYYNTGIGRFTQEDVIYNDGLNLYAYCSSNPVMYADPSGYAGGSVKQKTCGPKETSYGESSSILTKPNTTRINLANGRTRFTPLRESGNPVSAGMQHVIDGHFNRSLSNSRSIFTISVEDLKGILQRKSVIASQIIDLGNGQYKRVVDVGEIIGNTALKYGGKPTSWIEIITDVKGNIITTYPVPKP